MMPPPSAPLTDDGRGGGDLPLNQAADPLPAELNLPDDHPFTAALEWTDTHQHLWDLDKFNLPWTKGAGSLEKSHLLSHYTVAAEGLGITKSVCELPPIVPAYCLVRQDNSTAHGTQQPNDSDSSDMEVDVEPSQRQAEIDYITAMCADDSTVLCGAVIAGDPSSDGFEEYIRANASNPFVKGVRRVLHTPDCEKGYCLSDKFVAGITLLGELGLTFDLCLRPAELSDGLELAKKCPSTTLIIDHCGNADPYVVDGQDSPHEPGWATHTLEEWKDTMAALAAQPNVYCKLSGVIARAVEPSCAILKPTYKACIETFGTDKCFFGGDWPVCTLGAGGTTNIEDHLRVLQDTLEELGLLHADKKKIASENAARCYSL